LRTTASGGSACFDGCDVFQQRFASWYLKGDCPQRLGSLAQGERDVVVRAKPHGQTRMQRVKRTRIVFHMPLRGEPIAQQSLYASTLCIWSVPAVEVVPRPAWLGVLVATRGRAA
jgi:hypothetical protein